MIEAMACGTPTIAFNCGSVPEVMQEGLTGFIVDNMDQAVAAVKKIDTVERTACRNVFEKRFTATKMAEHYIEIYQSMTAPVDPGISLPSQATPSIAPRSHSMTQ
jgi:glycosyltransferase involved in cell wall biosynthesis